MASTATLICSYERENFFREADMGQRLLNAHCCRLLEIVDTDSMYVLVFELIATDVLAMIDKGKGQRLRDDEVCGSRGSRKSNGSALSPTARRLCSVAAPRNEDS